METLQNEERVEGQVEEQVEGQDPVQDIVQEKMNLGRFVLDIVETLVLAVILFWESMRSQRVFEWMAPA